MESVAKDAADTDERVNGAAMTPRHPFGVLVPTLGGQPIDAVHPDLVGDALAVISLKTFDDKLAVEHEMMAKRNSFRNLHRPELSHLEWVKDSAADKKEVLGKFATNRSVFLLTCVTVFFKKNFPTFGTVEEM
jgi:hypothetical protein